MSSKCKAKVFVPIHDTDHAQNECDKRIKVIMWIVSISQVNKKNKAPVDITWSSC